MRVMTILGTRPELIRLSLVFERFDEVGIDHVLVHTGQNYDPLLSDIFFSELGLNAPDVYLGIRGERAGQRIGRIIAESEAALLEYEPDALLILGDTDSGLSAIAAARLGIPIFHMEAGNRCFDWAVPEEKNRRLIDHISDWLLPYTARSREHLVDEGIERTRILVSGNPITDVLEHFRPGWEASRVLDSLDLQSDGYMLVTAHRQETVDVPHRLKALCSGLDLIAAELGRPVIFSVHPRTRERLDASGIVLHPAIRLEAPFGFLDFVALQAAASCVVTDSGTVQEECSLLHVPAVTCRDSTERPETIECGSNVLCGVEDPDRMLECVRAVTDRPRDWISPYAEDHNVAARIANYLVSNTALSRTAAASRRRPASGQPAEL
jgi:UDP-N-acetylglucosamine 2-epimerase (non-hydrolysing)